jgi:hypothetical protein
VIPFPVGFCYRQVAILPRLLGITIIISPTFSLEHLNLLLTFRHLDPNYLG